MITTTSFPNSIKSENNIYTETSPYTTSTLETFSTNTEVHVTPKNVSPFKHILQSEVCLVQSGSIVEVLNALYSGSIQRDRTKGMIHE